MKQILFIIVALMMSMNLSAQVVRTGNTFKSERKAYVRDTLVTQYKYEDGKGKTYPIVVNKKSGACYICKVSKNGKFYRQYMSKDIKLQICKELNITIKED